MSAQPPFPSRPSGSGEAFIAALLKRLRAGEVNGAWRDLKQLDRASADPDAHARLAEHYSQLPTLRIGSRTFACALFPAPPDQRDDPDSVLGPAVHEHASEQVGCFDYRDLVVEHARVKRLPVYNGSILALDSFTTGPRLQLSHRPGRYYDMLATCGGLRFEAQYCWLAGDDDPARWPLRQAADPLSGVGRCAAIAVSTLICFRRDHDYACLLHRRSPGKLAPDSGTYHVMPAAMLEATADGRPVSVTQTVLREYGEELFGHDEHTTPADCPAVRQLRQMIDSGEASLHLTGVAVNLLEMRPEICTLLLIHDRSWARSVLPTMTPNWEYADVQDATRLLDLHDDPAFDAMGPADLIIPAAAALAMGRITAKSLLS